MTVVTDGHSVDVDEGHLTVGYIHRWKPNLYLIQNCAQAACFQRKDYLHKVDELTVLANSVEISACLEFAKKHLICTIKAFHTEVPKQQLTCQKRPAPNTRMEHQLRYQSTKKVNLARSSSLTKHSEFAKKHLICTIKAFRTEVPKQQLTCQKRPAPNTRMEHQLRYQSTKKVNLARSSSLTKHSEAQAVEARQSLKDVDI